MAHYSLPISTIKQICQLKEEEASWEHLFWVAKKHNNQESWREMSFWPANRYTYVCLDVFSFCCCANFFLSGRIYEFIIFTFSTHSCFGRLRVKNRKFSLLQLRAITIRLVYWQLLFSHCDLNNQPTICCRRVTISSSQLSCGYGRRPVSVISRRGFTIKKKSICKLLKRKFKANSIHVKCWQLFFCWLRFLCYLLPQRFGGRKKEKKNIDFHAVITFRFICVIRGVCVFVFLLVRDFLFLFAIF